MAEANAAAMQVAVVTASKSMPVSRPLILPDRTIGCTTMI